MKADVVSEDLGEHVDGIGRRAVSREILNYGHTFAHAVERAERYRWRHGAAVSVGMVYAAELARLVGRPMTKSSTRIGRSLGAVGLPSTYRANRWPTLLEGMKMDKKSRGSMLRFIVLSTDCTARGAGGPDPALLVAAYAEVSDER